MSWVTAVLLSYKCLPLQHRYKLSSNVWIRQKVFVEIKNEEFCHKNLFIYLFIDGKILINEKIMIDCKNILYTEYWNIN